MAEPFLGELKLISWNFPQKGWAFCNGQFLPINQNQPLFSLLGTMYGGNGQTTFALPDLRGRTPIHVGQSNSVQGSSFGEEAHTLSQSELPAHNHLVQANNTIATQAAPGGAVLGSSPNTYTTFANPTTIAPGTLSTVGGSQPHTNLAPYLVLNWMIALQGIFPSRN
jgi:microcystin-dependent protein